MSTPREDGFFMPAEWAPHAGTWMIWPERTDNWRLGAKPAQKAFAEVAAAIARFEPVTMMVSARQFANARQKLAPSVRLVEVSTNDAWCRDVGASFLISQNGTLAGTDWAFNAWGGLERGLYFPWDLDDAVAAKMLEIERAARYRSPLTTEGGAIHVDGEGTVLTTEACLLTTDRNPGMARPEVEQLMKDYLGAWHVLWLGEGVPGAETGGHIDNLACFIRPGVVMLTWTDDAQEPLYAVCRDAQARLLAARDAQGRAIEIEKIPMPTPMFFTAEEEAGIDTGTGAAPRRAGERLAASYVNFYIAGGAIIAPCFGVPTDEPAREILQKNFPNREIIMIPAREILLGGGNIHCITQQQPQIT